MKGMDRILTYFFFQNACIFMDVLLLLLIFILSMVGNRINIFFFYTLKANKPIAVEKGTHFELNSTESSIQQGFRQTRDDEGCLLPFLC